MSTSELMAAGFTPQQAKALCAAFAPVGHSHAAEEIVVESDEGPATLADFVAFVGEELGEEDEEMDDGEEDEEETVA